MIFDLYSGTGTIAQTLAPVSRKSRGLQIWKKLWKRQKRMRIKRSVRHWKMKKQWMNLTV